jgi:phosphohistidine phosphatase
LKNLFFIRHAKSDQSFFGNDFERPLNERGKTDAPAMAKRLLEKKLIPDALVASPAVRAKTTAELFADTLQIPVTEIVFISALYQASSDAINGVVSGLPNTMHSVAIFSHNPGITYFVNSLKTKIRIDNMPTCGIFAVSAETDAWSGFGKAKKEALFFDYPKNPL